MLNDVVFFSDLPGVNVTFDNKKTLNAESSNRQCLPQTLQ